jgi:predicted permease
VKDDIRYACRALAQSREYASWVVGSLAIGMAVAIAALAFLNASMFRPFPGVTNQERLVHVSVSRNCGRPDCWIRMSSTTDYQALRDALTGLQGFAAHSQAQLAAALPDARSVRGSLTSAGFFDVLGVRMVIGRAFDTADENSRAAVAVIGHALWAREFAADPAVIGRTIRIAGETMHIVGVAPEFFAGIDRVRPGARGPELWLPIWMADRVAPLTRAEQRRQERDIYFVGRLKDGVSAAQVQSEAALLASQLALERGASRGRADVHRVWMVEPRNWQFGFIVILPIPILVLVIACVNAANLMLARGSQRQREIAIRLAIGAGRGRIIRQLLIESAVLTMLATAIALPIAWWSLQLAATPLAVPIPFDPIVLGLTVVTAAATVMAFGLVPAVRVSAQQPSSTLGSSGARGDALPRQSRMRRLLVVAQVALSLGLCATAWQLVSTVRSQAVSAGTPADRLLIARFDLQPLRLPPGQAEEFYGKLADGAMRLPGAEAAGLARHTAIWTFGQGAAPASLLVWRPDDRPEEGHVTGGGYAAGELVAAVGLRVVEGRGFTDADRRSRPQVAVINVTAASRMNGRPIGGTVRVAPYGRDYDSSIEVQIIGVIEAAVEPRLDSDDAPVPKIYLPSPLEPEPALALYLRSNGKAASLVQLLRELAARIDPRVPVLEAGSLEELNERSYAPQLWLARAAALIGVIGLVLATAGLYGVSSYVVAMRSRELAIRMALGAAPARILAMILGQSLRVACAGLIVGGGAAIAASRIIQSEYHGIMGIDAVGFAGASLLFLAAMLLAGAVPAARASRLDPVEVLRGD